MIQLKNKYQFRTYDTKNIGNGLKMCTILNRETTKKKMKNIYIRRSKHKKWKIMWYIVVTLPRLRTHDTQSAALPFSARYIEIENKINWIVSIWMNKLWQWHGMAPSIS